MQDALPIGSQTAVVLQRDISTSFNGGTRSPIEEVAAVVRRSFEKRTSGNAGIVVTTTLQKDDNVNKFDTQQSGPFIQLWNRASFQNEKGDMNEIGITTNRGYQHEIDETREKGAMTTIRPSTPSTIRAAASRDETIDMPVISGSPSDDFLYALEHML